MDQKKWLLLTLAVFLIAIVGACSSSSEESPTSASNGENDSTNQGTDSPEPITLTFATWDTNPTTMALFEKAVENYNKTYPHVTINIEGAQDYQTKLQTQLAAGSPPDIFQLGEGDFARHMRMGTIIDQMPYATGSNPIDIDDFIPNILNIGTIDGKLAAIPIGPSVMGVYYNKKLFDEAGVPYPEDGWTWDDFLEKAKKLTKVENGRTEVWGVNIPLGKDWVEPIVEGYGGSYMDPDGTTTIGYMDSEKTIEAVQWFVDLFRVHKVAPSPADTQAMAGIDMFGTGRLAMNITGPWPLREYREDPDLDFGVAGWPQFSDGTKTNFLYTAGYAISSKTEHPQEAWDFIRELVSPDTETGQRWTEWALAYTYSTAESSGQNDDPYLSVLLNEFNFLIESSFLKNAHFMPVGNKYFSPALESMILEGADVQTTLEDAAAKIDAELKEMDE